MNLVKSLLAAGVLLVSFASTSYIISAYTAKFASTSYIISAYTAKHAEQTQDDFINELGNSVVEIRDIANKKGGGTGFLVKAPSGTSYILTNNHICGLADNNKLLINRDYYADIISHSPDHDLCLVSNPLNLKGLEVGTTSRNGENIYIVGHPLLEPRAEVKGQISGTLAITVLIGYNIPCGGPGEREIDFDSNSFFSMFGIKSACLREYEAQATTANILPGNSGSPVLNIDGKVIGVVFAGREDGPGRGYIIPLKYIQKFLGNK